MTTTLTSTIVCGLVLLASFSTSAEPVDQQGYLSASEYKLEHKRHQWTDGSRYEGEWLKHQPHGYGTLNYSNGAQYSGRFNHGRREGQGIMKYENGDQYQGNWLRDQPHGRGLKRYIDGSVYEGEFEDGVHQGQGKQTYVDGTYYDGHWADNKPHGYGQLTFISGGLYEGSFLNGRPEGKGRYFYPNGDVYFGEWKNGNQHGKGRVDFNVGGYYKGDYIDGMKHGKGVMVSALGAKYSGPFRYNEAHGTGVCSLAAKREPCEYKHDKRVTPNTLVAKKPPTNSNKATTTAVAASATVVVAAKTPGGAASATNTAANSVQPKPKLQAQPEPEPMEFVVKPYTPEAKPASVAVVASVADKPNVEAKPQAKEQFTDILEKEKQQVKAMTLADLRQDRSDFYFKDNWAKQDLMAIPETAYWQKRSSLFINDMQIISVHGDTEIRLQVKGYKGPGSYKISNAWVESNSQNVDADQIKKGTIEILSDKNGWLVGRFDLTMDDGAGNALDFDNGLFNLSSKERLPSMYH